MINKAEAVDTLRQLGLNTTTVATYTDSQAMQPSDIERDLGARGRYVARTSRPVATLNLPRLIDASAAEVCQWAASLEPGIAVIVQEYDELAFCGQLAVYPDILMFELVSGMWELRGGQQPYRMTGDWNNATDVRWTRADGPVELQHCTWLYEPESSLGQAEDWMIWATQHWIQESAVALRQLLAENGNTAYGLKFHYMASHGIAAQNLYSNVPSSLTADHPLPSDCPTLHDVHQPVQAGTSAVVLEVSISREDASLFDGLLARLQQAGITRVYLRAGLLSHAAIKLREAGFETLSAS
jgi:hypothetical protein